MSLIESFRKTIIFFEGLQKEGFIDGYALIGGLALSAWVRPRTTRDMDLIVAVSRKTEWSDIAALVETRLSRRISTQKVNACLARRVIREARSIPYPHDSVKNLSHFHQMT